MGFTAAVIQPIAGPAITDPRPDARTAPGAAARPAPEFSRPPVGEPGRAPLDLRDRRGGSVAEDFARSRAVPGDRNQGEEFERSRGAGLTGESASGLDRTGRFSASFLAQQLASDEMSAPSDGTAGAGLSRMSFERGSAAYRAAPQPRRDDLPPGYEIASASAVPLPVSLSV